MSHPAARPSRSCTPLPSAPSSDPSLVARGFWHRSLASLAIAMLLAAPLAAGATTVEVRTAASTDDAEEFATGKMYLNSTDLELTHDTSDQRVGMRWILAIPQGATITAAWIQFSAKEAQDT